MLSFGLGACADCPSAHAVTVMTTTERRIRALPAVITAPSASHRNAPAVKRKNAADVPSQPVKRTATDTAAAAAGSQQPSEEPRQGLFADCRVVLFLGSDLTSGRRSILSEQIVKRGGEVVTALDRHCTHAIVPADYSAEQFAAWSSQLKPRHIERLQVKRVELGGGGAQEAATQHRHSLRCQQSGEHGAGRREASRTAYPARAALP